ncbi:hypothetical protein TrRE_jg3495 [Triparma retinervis]|uniref:Methyltransferase FkbM domain-containing protein n=1 Tax=Triparma retinervis TaxID=2557542 RepID=A0A9W7CKR8_9STRA|nr:hypothetical protein TrRE_jg3495 [Triparma retinervis]
MAHRSEALSPPKVPGPPQLTLEDLTLADSKTNFLPSGSFHLVLYPPVPSRCETHTIRARHDPPVDCSTFKGDTCNIYREVRGGGLTFHGGGGPGGRRYVRVRSAPIADIFRAWGRQRVDFWVLDVEGAERQVLEGMDFGEVEVGMIMIEVSQQGEDAGEIESLLSDAGFFKSKDFKSWNNLNSLYLNSAVWEA